MLRKVLARLLWLLLCLSPTLVPAAEPFRIEDLMALLAAVPGSHATFQEERRVAQLTTPVRDSGTLDYVRPGKLEKHTLVPRDERLVVDGDRLWLAREGQPTRNFFLEDQPEIGALVDSVRGTLAGDLPALQKNFAVTLVGTAEHWQLTLKPSGLRLAKLVSSVRIEGVGQTLRLVETTQADGSVAQMAITPG